MHYLSSKLGTAHAVHALAVHAHAANAQVIHAHPIMHYHAEHVEQVLNVNLTATCQLRQ
jgi:hypothetical protein